MEERYRQRATIITTNLDYSEWANFLGNKALVGALLSRLRHQCHTVKIEDLRCVAAMVTALSDSSRARYLMGSRARYLMGLAIPGRFRMRPVLRPPPRVVYRVCSIDGFVAWAGNQ